MKVFQHNSWSTTATLWGWQRACGGPQSVSDLPARPSLSSKTTTIDMLTIKLARVILIEIRTQTAPTTSTMPATKWVAPITHLASRRASPLRVTWPKARCKLSPFTRLLIPMSMRVHRSTKPSSFCQSAWWTHHMTTASPKSVNINWRHLKTRKDSLCCNLRSLSDKPSSSSTLIPEATPFRTDHLWHFLKTTKKRRELWKKCGWTRVARCLSWIRSHLRQLPTISQWARQEPASTHTEWSLWQLKTKSAIIHHCLNWQTTIA